MAELLDTYSDSESDAPAAEPLKVSNVSDRTKSDEASARVDEKALVSKSDTVAGAENFSEADRNIVAVAQASRIDDADSNDKQTCTSLVPQEDENLSRARRIRDKMMADRLVSKGALERQKEKSTEEFTKLRIENRLLDAAAWSKMMKNKQYIPMTRISSLQVEKKGSSSVFIGVLYDKILAKTAATGNKYATWLLTDMKSQPYKLSVQLYDQAFETWSQNADKSKLASRGSIFAILNAKVFPPRADPQGKSSSASRATCSVNNNMQLAKLGDYPLLALCTHKAKTDNRPCGNPIEKHPSNFGLCMFHAQEQHRHRASKQYTNNLIAACVPQRIHPKLEARVEERKNAADKEKEEEKNRAKQRKQEMSSTQRMIDFQTRLLSTNENRNKLLLAASLSGKSLLSTEASSRPLLARGLNPTEDLFLDVAGSVDSSLLRNRKHLLTDATKSLPSDRGTSSSSRNVSLELRKPTIQREAFPNLDPNNPLANKRRIQQAFGKNSLEKEKRPKIDLQVERKIEEKKKAPATQASMQEQLTRLYGKEAAEKVAMSREEMEIVRNAKSQGAHVVTIERMDECDRVRQELEFQDEFDLHKASVQFLTVSAWYCATCKLTTDNVSAKIACEASQHVVSEKKLKKTRWECRKCFQSSFVLDKAMPSSCKKCGNDTFKQASFFKAKSAAMERDLLEKRGADHERYLEHETKRRTMNDGDEYAGLDKY